MIDELLQVRLLIEKEENWTQKSWAKDGHGRPCPPRDPRACRFCLTGAVEKVVCQNDSQCQLLNFLNGVAAKEFGKQGVFAFNDELGRKHGDILGFLDRAIEIAREGGYDARSA